MKDKNNKEPNEYTTGVSGYIVSNISNNVLCDWKGISKIVINDDIKSLHIQYQGKEYEFDLVKALSILCKEVKNGK